MPYVNKPRPYKHEYQMQKARPQEAERRAARAKARAEYDKAGIDRTGKHIDHKKPLANGGSKAKSNTRLVAPKTNLSYARKSNHKPK